MTSFWNRNWWMSMIFVILTIRGSSSELKLLQSVFRHGDRYPLPYSVTKQIYPLNPYANVSRYPDSDGGLTSEGKRRSYELGNVFRARYGDWFGQKYSGKVVEFVSPRNERTKMTALLVTAGLFQPYNGSKMWNPSLNWQPVPISLVSDSENILFYGCLLCSKYLDLLETMKLNDTTFVEYDKRMKEMYDYVSLNTGAPVNNRILYYLNMEFLALMSEGLSPPKWSENIFLNGSLGNATAMEYKFSSSTDRLKRITGGIWLQRWLDHVDDYLSEDVNKISSKARKSEHKKKAFFYSGHDVNVAGIMNTLGIFYSHVPNYVSAINLELHEDEEQRFYVKVVHRDLGEFIEYAIPGCDDILCPLETFRNIFSNVVTFDPKEDCGPFRDLLANM